MPSCGVAALSLGKIQCQFCVGYKDESDIAFNLGGERIRSNISTLPSSYVPPEDVQIGTNLLKGNHAISIKIRHP